MPIGRVVLLVLAFPVGLAAYLVTGTLLTSAGLTSGLGGLLLVFLPLFVAGVCAIPLDHPVHRLQGEAGARGPRRRRADSDTPPD